MEHCFVAQIAMRGHAAVTYAALEERLKARFNFANYRVRVSPLDAPLQASRERRILLNLNEIPIVVVFSDGKLPEEPMAHALRHCHRVWPEAAWDLASHFVTATVAGISPANPFSPKALDVASAVTMVSAAICSLTQSVGVLWRASETVTSVSQFTNYARDLARKSRLPLEIWIATDLREDGGSARYARALVTSGLESLIGREVQFIFIEPDPSQYEHFYDLMTDIVGRLIFDPAWLRDGFEAQIGEWGERVSVRYLEEGMVEGVPMIDLRLRLAYAADMGAFTGVLPAHTPRDAAVDHQAAALNSRPYPPPAAPAALNFDQFSPAAETQNAIRSAIGQRPTFGKRHHIG